MAPLNTTGAYLALLGFPTSLYQGIVGQSAELAVRIGER